MNEGHDRALEPIRDLLEQGEYESALEQIERMAARARARDVQGALTALRYCCLLEMGDDETSDADFNHLLGLTDTAPESTAAAAMEFFDFDYLEEAEDLLAALTEQYPGDGRYAWWLAEVLEEDERFEDAAAWYDRAIELNPDNAEVYQAKAFCLHSMGDLEGASEALGRAIRLAPDNGDLWRMRAAALADAGDLDKAWTALEEAERRNADPVELYSAWAWAAFLRRDRPQLAKCCAKLNNAEAPRWKLRIAEGLASEMDGETWPGWEALRDALEAACESEDYDGIVAAAGMAMRYAIDHDFGDELDTVLPLLHRMDAFSDVLFAGLRYLHGRRSEKAAEFEVTVEGEVADAELVQALQSGFGVAPPFRFMRTYRVLAESDTEAQAFVEDFERRCGSGRLIIHSITAMPWNGEADLGIWDRGDSQYFTSTGEVLEY